MDLSRVAADVVIDLEVLVAEAGATVAIGDLPVVMGEPTQLRQLLQNLIENAIRFHSPDRNPLVTVAASVVPISVDDPDADLSQTMYRLTVEDNGIGIPDHQVESAFELFSQVHNQAGYRGSGVGLALCRRIVEYHGGVLMGESNSSGGFTAVATLPPKSPPAVDQAEN